MASIEELERSFSRLEREVVSSKEELKQLRTQHDVLERQLSLRLGALGIWDPSTMYRNDLQVGSVLIATQTELLGTVSAAANAGAGVLPATPEAFCDIKIAGLARKVPYYLL